jgi:hypothetical protein
MVSILLSKLVTLHLSSEQLFIFRIEFFCQCTKLALFLFQLLALSLYCVSLIIDLLPL